MLWGVTLLSGGLGDVRQLPIDMGKLDDRSVDIVVGLAQGMMNNEVAKVLNISAPRVCQIKEEWGEGIAPQVAEQPAWRRVLDNRR